MSEAADPGRTVRLCLECGDTTSADDSLTCPVCGHANFAWVPADADPAPDAGPSPVTPPPAAPPAAAAADHPAPGGVPPGTARQLRVTFVTGSQPWRLDVAPGSRILLGRDPGVSPHATALAADDTVSRRHALISLGPDGAPCIRDEYSTNGTFVNGVRLPAGAGQELRDGDRLQLGLGTIGKIRLVSAPAPPGQR